MSDSEYPTSQFDLPSLVEAEFCRASNVFSVTSLPARISRGIQVEGTRQFVLAAVSACFTAIGIAASVLAVAGADSPGWPLFIALLAVGIAVAMVGVAMPSTRQLRVPNRRTLVIIQVGDLFAMPDHIGIGANVHFDSSFPVRVSPKSLHGLAITKLYNGDNARFEREVDANLAEQRLTSEIVKGHERPKFPIGTTAVVNIGPKKLFLPAICHTDIPTFKASAEVEDLWKGLCGLWRAVRRESNGERVAIPLMGSGQAQVNLTSAELLRLILMSINYESQEREITKEIAIVLTEQTYKDIDLRSIELE